LRNVREIVAGERDRVGLPVPEPALEGAMTFDLQIDEAHLVARAARGFRGKLEPERLQAQEHLRVHERSRVDREDLHRSTSPRCRLDSAGRERFCPVANGWRLSAP